MSHEDTTAATTIATRRPPRRVLRPIVPDSQECPRAATKPNVKGVVYAVKSELRSPATGHPLIEPATLAVDEVYLTKPKAIAKMRLIVDSSRAFEISRGRSDSRSPAWLNVIPVLDTDAESIQVTRADGMILRYYIDEIPLL